MRPPKTRQSSPLAPLNDILGTEGAVRLLRALSELGGRPSGVGALAEATQLERSSARRSLGTLVETGIVEALGGGRTVLYQLRLDHPLAGAVVALFRAEREKRPVPTPVDLPVLPPASAPRAEPQPGSFSSAGSVAHRTPTAAARIRAFDVHAPAFAQALAERIVMDATLVERAQTWVMTRLAADLTPQERFALEQWNRILRIWASTRIARLMTDRDDRAARMRETMPFLAVMRKDELEMLRRATLPPG